jgi:hypothetical protein
MGSLLAVEAVDGAGVGRLRDRKPFAFSKLRIELMRTPGTTTPAIRPSSLPAGPKKRAVFRGTPGCALTQDCAVCSPVARAGEAARLKARRRRWDLEARAGQPPVS